MKILFLRDKRTPPIDGAGIYLLRLCKVLNKKKIPYLLLYGSKKDLYYRELKKNRINVKYVDFPRETPKNFFRYFRIYQLRQKIKKLVIDGKFDIINTHFPHLNFFVDKSIKIPLISHWHGADVENKPLKVFYKRTLQNYNIRDLLFRFYRKLNVFNFDLARFVIVHGNASRNTAVKKYKVNKSKIRINSYGVDSCDLNKIKTIRNEFKIPVNTKIILSVGRIVKDKGVEEFCELAKQFKKYKVKFIYIGTYRDLDYYKYVLNKYSKYVIFPGNRLDVNSFYKSSYLFILLSKRESAGLVMAEAMNFGIPLIGWNVIGVNEIIKDRYNGYLIRYGDFEKLKKITKNLILNKKKHFNISKNSFDSFKNFNIEESTDRLLKIFSEAKRSSYR